MSWLLLLAAVSASALDCSTTEPCLVKCCPEKHVITGNKCIPGDAKLEIPQGVKLIYRKPCTQMYSLTADEEHHINKNGTVTTYEEGSGASVRDYCVDWNELNDTYTYVCFPDYEDDPHIERNALTIYSLGLFISTPFLLATFLVYVCFMRQRLHDICIIFHVLSMLLSYVVLAIAQNELTDFTFLCSFTGYAIQFFFMATFFWLNVMCFDIYWAFSGLKSLTGSVKERERKKLILYSCYAWGLPLLILLVTVGIDYSPYIPDDSIFKPNVGDKKCFFKENSATGIYFYTPMGIILVVNIMLFSITAYRICTLRRETAVLKRGDSRKHDSTNDKERFSLYLKLFLVMGINWVMEVVSFIVGGPGYIWYIPDFTNTLQGVFIFIIFVWKERVRRLVWDKMASCCGCKVVSNGPFNQWANSSRHMSSLTNSSQVTNNSMKTYPNGINGNGAVLNHKDIQTSMA